LQLDWGAVKDYAAVSRVDGEAGHQVRTDGRLAFIRAVRSSVTRWALFEGTSLELQSTELVLLSEPASAVLAGTALHLDRSNVQFRAFGPSVTQVLGPAGPLPFTRDGSWVESTWTTSAGPPALGPRTVIAGGDASIQIDCVSDPARAARIAIHDVRGRVVRALWMQPGDGTARAVDWDCRDAHGKPVGAGVYFVRAPECSVQRLSRIVVVR
jgi:hypothetical protein